MPIERMMTVYHEEYGKGYVLNIKHRHKDNLLMCSFPKGHYVFITERQLRSGEGEVTLQKQRRSRGRRNDSLESAIRSIIGG